MMTALTGDERFTGIEVREFRGVGFSVVSLWQGKLMNRHRLFHSFGAANEWAERLTAMRANPHEPIKDATASGHGIGKSTEVAWLILWSTMTHEDSRGVCTANTEGQLRNKTWPELSKWFALLQFDVLREMFVLEATSLHSTQPGHERTWRFDAIPWSERNPEAFAGLHNAGKRIVLLFDEASSIIDAIWDTASGALTDAGTEILFLAFGNPTRNSGYFHSAFKGRHRTEWRHRMIDGRDVKRTNKAQLQAWIDTYGDDSDFVRVRVKGQFPRAGTTQFISTELVQGARKREVCSAGKTCAGCTIRETSAFVAVISLLRIMSAKQTRSDKPGKGLSSKVCLTWAAAL